MPIYTFHLRRSDEVATGLDVLDLDHDAAAFRRAGELLDEHLSCEHVEVWEGERLVVSRHRDQPILRPLRSHPNAAGLPPKAQATTRGSPPRHPL